jgi:hypothetical protein
MLRNATMTGVKRSAVNLSLQVPVTDFVCHYDYLVSPLCYSAAIIQYPCALFIPFGPKHHMQENPW